ncbi:MAG: hypothetical protein U0Q15_05480 [Kineosporiaceae bacterium]
MFGRSRPAPVLSVLTAAAALAASAVALPGGAAQATGTLAFLPVISSMVLDSSAPTVSVDPAAAPVVLGTSTGPDGTSRVQRLVVTFDLKPFARHRVTTAALVTREDGTAPCATRAWEAWSVVRTRVAPTWSKPWRVASPVGRVQTPELCPPVLEAEVTEAVAAAVDSGATALSLQLSVPREHEADPAWHLPLAAEGGVALQVRGDAIPPAPVKPFAGSQWCGADPVVVGPYAERIGVTTSRFSADAVLTAEFDVWSADTPGDPHLRLTQTVTPGQPAVVRLSPDQIVDGIRYRFRARLVDQGLASPWGPTCTWVPDRSAPAAPVVTSTDGGPLAAIGGPVKVTFSSPSPDVVGYRWSWGSLVLSPGCGINGPKRLDCPDILSLPDTVRGATVSLSLMPDREASSDLSVVAIDSRGNRSMTTTVPVFVSDTRPSLVLPTGPVAPGKTFEAQVTPDPLAGEVVAYLVRVGDRRAVRVPAASASGPTTLRLTMPKGDAVLLARVQVRSVSANGWVSEAVNGLVLSTLL